MTADIKKRNCYYCASSVTQLRPNGKGRWRKVLLNRRQDIYECHRCYSVHNGIYQLLRRLMGTYRGAKFRKTMTVKERDSMLERVYELLKREADNFIEPQDAETLSGQPMFLPSAQVVVEIIRSSHSNEVKSSKVTFPSCK